MDLKNQFKGLEELGLNVDQTYQKLRAILLDTTKKHLSCVNRKKSKHSSETQKMIEERRIMNHNTTSEHRLTLDTNKKINKVIKRDLRKYSTDIVIKTIERYRGPKVF